MLKIIEKLSSFINVKIENEERTIHRKGNVEVQKIDELKSLYNDAIEKITIDSSIADVNISVSDSPKIEAHFYGQAQVNGNIKFDMQDKNNKLIITLKTSGNIIEGDFKLDITIPKKIFKSINVESDKNISLGKGVLVDDLQIESLFGFVKTAATFTSVYINTQSKDVELYINAIKDIDVHICTLNGNVTTKFKNVGHIDLTTNVMFEDVENLHKEEKGFNASFIFNSISGNLSIK